MPTRATQPAMIVALLVVASVAIALLAARAPATSADRPAPAAAQASVRPLPMLAGPIGGTATPTATMQPLRVVRVTRIPVTFAPLPPTVTPTPTLVVDGTLTLTVSAWDGTTVTQTWAWSTSRANAPAIAPVPMTIALGPSAELDIRLTLTLTQTRDWFCRGSDDRSTTYGRRFSPELYPTQPWRECFHNVLIDETVTVPTGATDPLTRRLGLCCAPVDRRAPACDRILRAFGGTATPRWVSVPLATLTFTPAPVTPTPPVVVQRGPGPTPTLAETIPGGTPVPDAA